MVRETRIAAPVNCNGWLAAGDYLCSTPAHGDKLSAGAGPPHRLVRGGSEW